MIARERDEREKEDQLIHLLDKDLLSVSVLLSHKDTLMNQTNILALM